jgi:hypothetical protein
MLAQFQLFTFGERGLPAEVAEKTAEQESPGSGKE